MLCRDYRHAYQGIIDYMERDTIPVGPGPVDTDSPLARQYTELILLLDCFAETYEMNDLANRSIDAL